MTREEIEQIYNQNTRQLSREKVADIFYRSQKKGVEQSTPSSVYTVEEPKIETPKIETPKVEEPLQNTGSYIGQEYSAPLGLKKSAESTFKDYINARKQVKSMSGTDTAILGDNDPNLIANNLRKKLRDFGYTDSQISKLAEDYEKEEYQKNLQETVEKNKKFADEHPVLGSAKSVGTNLLSGAESLANVITGLQGGNDQTNYLSNQTRALREGASNDLGKFGKGVYNLGMGAVDMGAQALIGGGLGGAYKTALTAGLQGVNAAGQGMEQAQNLGVDSQKAALTGLGKGTLAYGLGKGALDRVWGEANGLSVLQNALRGAGTEAVENIGEDALGDVLDIAINKDKSRLANMDAETGAEALKNYALEMLQSAGTGALFGGALGAVNGFKNRNIPSLDTDIQKAQTQTEQAKAEIENLKEQIPETPEREAVKTVFEEAKEAEKVEPIEPVREEVFDNAKETAQKPQEQPLNTQAEEVINEPHIAPTKAYDVVSKRLKQMTNWWGTDKTNGKLAELKTLLDDYTKTSNQESLERARQLATEIDADSQGLSKTYTKTTKKGKKGERKTNTTYNFGEQETFTDMVDMYGQVKAESEFDSVLDKVKNSQSNEEYFALTDQASKLLEGITDKESAEIRLENVMDEAGRRLAQNRTNVEPQPEPIIEQQTTANEFPTLEQPTVEQPTNSPSIPEIENPDMEVSKYYKNTMQRDNYETEENLKKYYNEKMFEYAVDHEKETLKAAAANLTDFDYCEKRYLDISHLKDATPTDIDTMYGMREKYIQDRENAIANGNQAEADLIQQKLNTVTGNIRQLGTSSAKLLQSLAKYTRGSAEDALFVAEVMQESNTKKWQNSNTKTVERVKDLSNKIKTALDTMGKDEDVEVVTTELPKEDIIEHIKSLFDEEPSSISKNFDDSDYEYLYDLVKNGATAEEIQNLISTKLATGNYGIPNEVRQRVTELFNEAEMYGSKSKNREDLLAKAFKTISVATNTHGTFKEKFDNFRYWAMLSSPRTHIRNIIGNGVMNVMSTIKDDLATIGEIAVDEASKKFTGNGIERTKAFLNLANENDINLLKESYKNAAEVHTDLADGNKYTSIERGINANKDIYKSKILNKLTSLNTDALDAEDTRFLYIKYSQALAKYLKANKADASIFDARDDASIELLSKAQDYAIQQAKEATFHQYSETAQSLSNLSRKLSQGSWGSKTAGFALDSIIPFKKTPINITKTAIEYSPAGITRLPFDMYKVSKGEMKASQLIDNLAKTGTGTGLLIAGAMLAKADILRGSDNGEDKYFNQLTGKQAYSLRIGDKNYTIDSFAPATIPLLIGANLFSAKESNGFENLLNALSTIPEPIIETTMLSGISDFMNAVASNDDSGADVWINAMTQIVSGYIGQYASAEMGNIARSVDEERRTSYTGKTGVANMFGKAVNQFKSKIPAIGDDDNWWNQNVSSKSLEPYVNMWGEHQKQTGGNLVGRLAFNHLSPSYVGDENMNAVEQKIESLYSDLKDAAVLPSLPSSSQSINGEKIKLSPKQYTQLKETVGQSKLSLLDTMFNTEAFNGLSPNEQALAIEKIYSLSNEIGKHDVFKDYEKSDSVYKTYKEEGAEKAIGKIIENAMLSANDLSTNDSLAKEAIANGTLDNYIETKQQLESYGLTKTSVAHTWENAKKHIPSIEEFASTYKKIDSNGNQGITQDEMIAYFNRQNVNEAQADKLWKAYIGKSSKIPVLEKGTWKKK